MKFQLLITLSLFLQTSALHGLKAKLSPLNSPALKDQSISGAPIYSDDYLPDWQAAQVSLIAFFNNVKL